MKVKHIFAHLKLVFRRILTGKPCLFAECCCGLRGPMYVGNPHIQLAVELDDFGCWGCNRFSHGCWGPRLKTY